MSKVAAIQMCSSHKVDENLKSVARLLEESANNGAKLIVLPEMFPIFGSTTANKLDAKEHFGSGKIQDFLSAQAAQHSVWIVGGTIPISCNNENKIRAACIVYDDHGKAVARYDKIHLFDALISEKESYKESDTTEAGDALVVIDTPVGKLGLAVCYDIRFPTMFTHLFNKGAEIIAIPSAFTVKTGEAHWELLARSRAVENFCYILGACQGGVHESGRETYGNSLIIDPWGCIVEKRKASSSGIVYSNIDLENLYKIRAAIPVANHQRIVPDISGLEKKRPVRSLV